MTQEIAEICAGREVYYSFFSRMIMEIPTAEIYELLDTIYPYITAMGDEGIELANFIENRKKLSDAERQEQDTQTSRDYTRLFCLGNGAIVAESYFTSREHILMQESRDEALKYYRKWGFEVNKGVNEPEDHIAYELMFMSFLCKLVRINFEKNDLETSEQAYNDSKEFLETHLLNWVVYFVKQIASYDASKLLYLPLCKFMLAFLQADIEHYS